MARYTSVHDMTKPAPQPTSTPEPLAPRSNKYAGTCRLCGVRVQAEAGFLLREDGAYLVEHKPGECVVVPGPAIGDTVVPDGMYTVVHEDGTHTTVRVDTEDEWRSGKTEKEVRVVRLLTGSDNQSDFTNVGEFVGTRAIKLWFKFRDDDKLNMAIQVLVHDPRAASAAYGLISEHCGICGRELSNPDSIKRGIGPKCAKDAGWSL